MKQGSNRQAVLRALRQLAARDNVTWSKGAQALKRLGPAAVPELIEVLRGHEDPVLRRTAATAMYMQPVADGNAAQALIDALADADPAVRDAAVRALSRVAPASGVEVPDAAIALAVASLAASGLRDRYGAVATVNELACVVKSRIAAAVPALIETLQSRDGDTRCTAVATLWHIGKPAASAVPEVIRLLLEDKMGYVRRAAALTLPDIGASPTLAVPALVRALGDTNAEVREAVAKALGAFGPKARGAVKSLKALLEDKKPPVREAAAAAIKQIRP